MSLLYHCQGNPPHKPLVEDSTLNAWLDRAAVLWPDNDYLIGVDANNTTRFTFAEFAAAVRHSAAVMVRNFGLKPGDMVVIIPENSPYDMITFFAVLRLNASVTIVSGEQAEQRLKDQIDRISPALIISNNSKVTHFDYPFGLGVNIVNSPSDTPLDQLKIEQSDLGEILLFTTGSTSIAKIVRLSQHNFCVNGMALLRHHELAPGKVLFSANPVYYANALGFVVIAAMMSGATGVLLRRFDPFSFLRLAEEYNATHLNMVPATLEAALDAPRAKVPACVQYAVTAAAPLPQSLAHRAYSKHHLRIVQGYGLTETTNFSLIMPIDLTEKDYIAAMVETDNPAVGVPVFGCDVTIIDGEIVMRGQSVMKGYLGNRQATDEAFANDWFHSGDLGQKIDLTSGLTVFRVAGRLKNVVKRRGIAVSLEEMERTLCALPGVRDAAIVATPSDADTRLSGICILEKNQECPSREQLNAVLRNQIGNHCVLDDYVTSDQLPRFANGKLVRHSLADYLKRDQASAD